MMGTNDEPCMFGSSAIISYYIKEIKKEIL
jgi:hypothetical protein